MKLSFLAILIGFTLDLILGDPHSFPHPIRLIGTLINRTEHLLRNIFPNTPIGEKIAGCFLVIIILSLSTITPILLLLLANYIHPVVRLILESIMNYQILATKSLKVESMKVYKELKNDNIEKARYNVSMIVGRDTASLDKEGIAKAAVETVAENTSDGSIAPLFFLFIGGAPLGFFYKAANTMDSMIGYKNDNYINFGMVAAKLDDVLNYIPARISAYLMIFSTLLLRLNTKHAYIIYKRDRYNHASPNSAHTEAVCAGALGVKLAGDAYYFGKLCKKPYIGDALRPITYEDIKTANQLLYTSACISLLVFGIIKILWITLL